MLEKNLILINRISLSLFFIVVLDIFFLQGTIKIFLPDTITSFTWYYIIFGLPHILASYVSYCNHEYFSFYKHKLCIHFIVNFGIILFFILFLPKFFIYFFILYTMYHVVWQQLGLNKKYIGNRTMYFMWSASGLLSATALAVSVGGESGAYIPEGISSILQTFGGFTVTIFLLLGLLLAKKNEYTLTTTLIIFCASLCILVGYPIVGVIMIRFTHDITAFSFYIQHDVTHQKKYGTNFLYNISNMSGIFIIFFLPIVSILLSYILQKNTNLLCFIIIAVLSFTHYSMEGLAWKRGTPHRNTLEI